MNVVRWACAVLICFSATCALPRVAAGDLTWESNWMNSVGGAWADAANWDGGVPDSEAAAVFDLGPGSAFTVSFSASAEVNSVRARTGTLDFALGGQTLDILDALFVGWEPGDDAHLRPDNGLLLSTWADVGHHTGEGGAAGRMTLSGPDASWVNSMDITVARGSTGRLDVLDGANVSIGRSSYVGNTGSGELHAADGTLNVSGTDSGFYTQRLTIGFANGGAQAVGTVTVSDHATLASTAAQIAAGGGGTGYLNVFGGSTVSSAMGTSPSSSSGIIGASYPGWYGVGVVTLSDADTSWTQDGSLSVGFTGDGTLTVQLGAEVSSRWGHVARRAGSVGQVTITGSDSIWNVADELYVGGEAGVDRGGLGAGGQGRLDVRDSGVVLVDQRVELWEQGTLDVTGGGRLLVGSGGIPAVPDQLCVGSGGLLAGSGAVLGTVVNLGGVIAPGHSTGILTVDELDLQAGSLELEIGGLVAGADYDVLSVNGQAVLGGKLTLVFVEGFLPETGQTFDLMPTGQPLAGGFDEVEILGLAPGWDYGMEDVDGVLRLTSYNDAAHEPLTVSGQLDADWVYQNTTTTTQWRHKCVLTISVDDDPTGNTSYTTLVAPAPSYENMVTCEATANPCVWIIRGGQCGVDPCGEATLDITVTGNEEGGLGTTTATVAVRPLGDITGDGNINAVDKARMNAWLNAMPLPGDTLRHLDLTGDGFVNAVDKVQINRQLNGLGIL